MADQPLILIVDDSEDDLMLMRLAFKKAKLTHNLQVVRSGEEAITYLQGSAPFEDRQKHPLPALVMLDLNMPKKSGFDVLAWMQTQPSLQRVIVTVLTASMRHEDVEQAFKGGAHYFLVKPSSLEQLTDMMQTLNDWVRLNHFPPCNEMVTY